MTWPVRRCPSSRYSAAVNAPARKRHRSTTAHAALAASSMRTGSSSRRSGTLSGWFVGLMVRTFLLVGEDASAPPGPIRGGNPRNTSTAGGRSRSSDPVSSTGVPPTAVSDRAQRFPFVRDRHVPADNSFGDVQAATGSPSEESDPAPQDPPREVRAPSSSYDLRQGSALPAGAALDRGSFGRTLWRPDGPVQLMKLTVDQGSPARVAGIGDTQESSGGPSRGQRVPPEPVDLTPHGGMPPAWRYKP
jgi:hypothetical protein